MRGFLLYHGAMLRLFITLAAIAAVCVTQAQTLPVSLDYGLSYDKDTKQSSALVLHPVFNALIGGKFSVGGSLAASVNQDQLVSGGFVGFLGYQVSKPVMLEAGFYGKVINAQGTLNLAPFAGIRISY